MSWFDIAVPVLALVFAFAGLAWARRAGREFDKADNRE